MGHPYDTTAFLAAVRRRGQLPAAVAPGYADADILDAANEEVLSALVPAILKVRRDYFTISVDVPLVAGVSSYRVPSRAAFAGLREAQLVDAQGKHKNIVELDVTRLDGLNPTAEPSTPTWYYWRGSSIVLVPAPDASSFPTLRLWHHRRPNRLVTVDSVLAVTDISGAPEYAGTKPSTILTTTACDVVRGSPHFDSLQDDVTPQAVDSGSVTFSAEVDGIAVGDYVCLAGEAPVLQLPPEFFAWLVLRTARAILAEKADPQLERDTDRAETAAIATMAPLRNEGEVEIVVSTTWD